MKSKGNIETCLTIIEQLMNWNPPGYTTVSIVHTTYNSDLSLRLTEIYDWSRSRLSHSLFEKSLNGISSFAYGKAKKPLAHSLPLPPSLLSRKNMQQPQNCGKLCSIFIFSVSHNSSQNKWAAVSVAWLANQIGAVPTANYGRAIVIGNRQLFSIHSRDWG